MIDLRSLRPNNSTSPQFSHLLWVLYWPAYGIAFGALELLRPAADCFSVHCRVDDLIPFCYFFIPYLFWFVFLVGMNVYLALWEPKSFRKFMHFVAFTYTLTLLIYVVWPTKQDLRPTDFVRDNFFTHLAQAFYHFDTMDGGTVIVKLFLEISEKEQAKRFEKLLGSKDTAWRVTEKERERNAHYGKYKKISDEMIRRTDMPYAPWYVIDAKDKTETALTVIKTVADVLEKALEKRGGKEPELFEAPLPPDRYEKGILAKADLTKSLKEAEYRKKLAKLQKRLETLHGELYRLRIPVILGFEGWDAAGKGGAIIHQHGY